MGVQIIPTLTRLRNYNNCLIQQYFGQVAELTTNGVDLIGTISMVEHVDIGPINMCVKLLSIIPIRACELENKDQAIYINTENVIKIHDLCGFDAKNLPLFQYYTGLKGNKTVGLYIFKNLNY